MRFLQKVKDGGPESPVDAYVLVEIKSLFSIILLKFNSGGRRSYHTHAFNAWSWFLCGDLQEIPYGYEPIRDYKRSFWPKVTTRDNNHKVFSFGTSWVFTLRGPWASTWTETRNGKDVTLTNGRVEL